MTYVIYICKRDQKKVQWKVKWPGVVKEKNAEFNITKN